MRYFSGFAGATGYFYISKKRQVLMTDFRYIFQAKEEVLPGITVMEPEKNYRELLRTLVREDGVKSLAFEGMEILYNDFALLSEYVKGENGLPLQWVPLKEELSGLRAIKTAEEIKKIRQAEHIGDLAFSHILNVLKPGMTELQVAAELEYAMKKNGAEGFSFDTIAASGIHSSMPHAVPTEKKLEKGEFLTMDFGCVYQGYCSDMTRTVVIGKADEEQKKVYDAVLTAQKKALEAIKADVCGRDIDKVARDYIYENGYEGCFGHGLGHSVGLFIHENPRFSPSCDDKIPEGAVITVEPGIYLENYYGVRIEDLVVVTKDGYENLTASEKKLLEIV